MRALAIHQPYANFIADGTKRYETRSWPTSYRGLLAIHASKNREETEYSGIAQDGPFGAIVAVGRLVGCHRAEEIRDSLSKVELDVGLYIDGYFAFELADVEKLAQPIPSTGYHRIWRLPSDIAAILESGGDR